MHLIAAIKRYPSTKNISVTVFDAIFPTRLDAIASLQEAYPQLADKGDMCILEVQEFYAVTQPPTIERAYVLQDDYAPFMRGEISDQE